MRWIIASLIVAMLALVAGKVANASGYCGCSSGNGAAACPNCPAGCAAACPNCPGTGAGTCANCPKQAAFTAVCPNCPERATSYGNYRSLDVYAQQNLSSNLNSPTWAVPPSSIPFPASPLPTGPGPRPVQPIGATTAIVPASYPHSTQYYSPER
jgi:hypothetical protein